LARSAIDIGARLLSTGDPEPVLRVPAIGSNWLLLCDHAGNAVPARLQNLGLRRADLDDHIGIDIGIWPVTQSMAKALGEEAIGQAYSRLVIDCNRQPGTLASIPASSDNRVIPGNDGAPFTDERIREIFTPYHDAIVASLAAHTGRRLICSMHSFTRELAGQRRAVDIGVIHGPDSRLADAMIDALQTSGLSVARNAPYRIDFDGDYTLPVHAEAAGLDYVEIEICQDLIGTIDGQAGLARIMAGALVSAQASLS
jgi:predicted N-formylglutamate amidohydrolase